MPSTLASYPLVLCSGAAQAARFFVEFYRFDIGRLARYFEPMALATGFVEYCFSRQNPTLARRLRSITI